MSASSLKNMGRTKGNHQRYLYAEQLWESSVKFIGSEYNLILYTLIISHFFTVLMPFSCSSILIITTEQNNDIVLGLRNLYAP